MALFILCASSLTGYAIAPANEYQLTKIEINGQLLEVPVYMEKNINRSFAANSETTTVQHIFVPATKEAMLFNSAIVNNIKHPLFRSLSSDTFKDLDSKGYVEFESTLSFTLATIEGVKYYDFSTASLKYHRAESSTSSATVGKTTGTIYQLGYLKNGNIAVITQYKDFTVSSLPATISYPSSWVPVSNRTHAKGVKFTATIKTTGVNATTYQTSFSHLL